MSWLPGFVTGYEEAQSRLRLSMTCRDMMRPLTYPLEARIVELASVLGPTLPTSAKGLPHSGLRFTRRPTSDVVARIFAI